MVLNITRPDGRERTDVVTEVLKYLRYRYELSERALVHHAKLAADAMIGKALEMWFDILWVDHADDYIRAERDKRGRKSRYRSPAWLSGRDVGEIRQRFEGAYGEEAHARVERTARDELDDHLSTHGDDALLERLAELNGSRRSRGRAEGVRHLSRALLDRRLYKQIATQDRPPKGPDETFKEWGTAEQRRELEEDAARWAGLEHRWQVLLWIPPHEMRLKIADVIVDAGDAGIMSFSEYERRGKGRGTDIYEAHRALWSVGVYIHPMYATDDLAVRKVVARLAKRMNMTFTQLQGELGGTAHLWPDQLAARTIVAEAHGPPEPDRRPDLVEKLMETVRTEQVQARGPSDDDSWASLYSRYQGAAAGIEELT